MLGNISSKTINDFASLIEIINNSDHYSEAVLELKKQSDNLKNERLKITKAKELDQQITEYKAKNETAAKLISEAKDEASKILSEAKDEAIKVQLKSESEVQNIYEEAKKTRLESQQLNAESEYLRKESEALKAQAQQLMDQAIALGAENKRVKKELEEKREALEKALKM
jgi:chromosome segregation ATPase